MYEKNLKTWILNLIANKRKTINAGNQLASNGGLYLVFKVDSFLPNGAQLSALGHEHDQEREGTAAKKSEPFNSFLCYNIP